MATTYTPNPTVVHADITVPSDGDFENVASVNGALEALADNAAEARQHIAGAAIDTTIGASQADTLIVKAFSNFQAAASFDATASFGVDVDFAGSPTSAEFEHKVQCDGTLEVDGAATFKGGVIVDTGALIVDHNMTVTGPSTLNGDSTLGANNSDTVNVRGVAAIFDKITFLSQGRAVFRYHIMGNGNETTFGPKDFNFVWVSGGTLSASRTFTIDDTNAVDGDWMVFANVTDSTHTLTVKSPASVTLATLSGAGAADGTALAALNVYTNAVLVMRMGGSWFAIFFVRNVA